MSRQRTNHDQEHRTTRNERRAVGAHAQGGAEKLFRLRIQAQTERLDAPSELRQAAPADRPDQDDSERSESSKRRPRSPTDSLVDEQVQHAQASRLIGVVTSDKMAKTRRVEIPPLGPASEVRQVRAPPDGLPRARREQRVAHRATRSRSSSARPRSKIEAVGVGAGRGEEQAGRHRGDARSGEAGGDGCRRAELCNRRSWRLSALGPSVE